MLFFIMIISGIAKEYALFLPVYSYIKSTFRSNKAVLVLLSAVGGILPIEGRVTVSAGLLDTVAPKQGEGRQKYGIIDYLSTHHYYMWSPLEKTVILPIAAFGMTYAAWLSLVWPLIAISVAFIFWYVWYQIKDQEIDIAQEPFKISSVVRNVVPMMLAIGLYIKTEDHIWCFGGLALYYMLITQAWNIKKLLSYINWEVILTVGIVIILGTYLKTYDKEMQEIIRSVGVDSGTMIGMSILTVIGFVFSFLMGSSGKFVAFAVLMSQIVGIEYFLWFFVVDYAGYLLSPTHKCVMVGNRYFGTPFVIYYKALGTWIALMVITVGFILILQ